jgi:hypothetical protein
LIASVTSDAASVTAITEAPVVVEGSTFTLTTGTDVKLGVAGGDDTFTATSTTLQAGDTLIDEDSTDNDTLNLTLTAVNNAATVSGFENINVDWDAFGTATVNATNFSGATITVSSDKLGYLGATAFTAAGANTVVAGEGANGAMDVNGGTAVTVNMGTARTATVDATGTAPTAIVNAGAATTTIDVGSATAFVDTTVVGGAATTAIEVNGTAGLTDTADITMVRNGTLSVLTAEVETVSLTASADLEVTLANASLIDDMTVTSEGAVTLIARSDELTVAGMSKGLTDATAGLTIELTSDAAADLTKVGGSFDLQNDLQGDTDFASGTSITLSAAMATGALNSTTGTSDVLTATATVDQTFLDVTDGTHGVETLNLVATHGATETDGEIDINRLDATAVVVSGASKVRVGDGTASGTDDANVTSFDASALTGELNFTEGTDNAAAAVTVVGSSTAKNTVVLATTTAASSYTGGEGVDIVTLAQTTGDSTVVLGNGANTYTNTTLTDGTAVVLGGTGVDTITLTATDSGADTANVVIQSGAGNDVVTLDLAGAAADEQASVDLGAGDDKITLGGTATNAGDILAIDGGDDSDTIDLNDTDLSLGTVTFAGIETVDDSGGAGVVDGSELTGQTYTIKGNGNQATLLDVTTATAGSYDFSGLVIDNTLADGIGGLSITGNAGNDVIVGTSGNDTIDSNGGNDTLTGGLGVDTYVGGGGVDTIVIASADTGKTSTTADIINVASFTSTTDKLKLGVDGTALNFTSASADGGATDALGVAAAIIAADLVFDGAVKYYFYDNTNVGADNGYLVIDADLDGTSDDVIIVTGATAANSIVFGDIIA